MSTLYLLGPSIITALLFHLLSSPCSSSRTLKRAFPFKGVSGCRTNFWQGWIGWNETEKKLCNASPPCYPALACWKWILSALRGRIERFFQTALFSRSSGSSTSSHQEEEDVALLISNAISSKNPDHLAST